MSFTQKIYYNNKPLVLTTDAAGFSKKLPGGNWKLLSGATPAHFEQAIAHLEQSAYAAVIIEDPSREKLEKELLWSFLLIHSGGGVVRNEAGEVLMIFRRGKWDLPKGKQDEGEDIATCAIREVSEETGLKKIAITQKLCNTLHIYNMSGQMILKCTTWFLMSGTSLERLTPQREEFIEQAVWAKPSEINKLLDNSFDTVRDVLVDAGVL